VDNKDLKKQRLKDLNERVASGQLDIRNSVERLMDKVHQIRFEVDFMLLKQQCKKIANSPTKNRYRDAIKNNPCLQSFETDSPGFLVTNLEHRFFSSSPGKKSVRPTPLSPKAKSPAKAKSSPYSPIGMSR